MIKTTLMVRESEKNVFGCHLGWMDWTQTMSVYYSVQGRNRCCKVGRKQPKEGTPTQPTRVIYRNVKCRIRGNIPTLNIWKILTLDLSTLQQSGCQWFWTNTMLVSAAHKLGTSRHDGCVYCKVEASQGSDEASSQSLRVKAKIHYASWFGAGSEPVRSRFGAEIWPII